MRNQAGRTTFLGSFPGELPAVTLPEVAFAGRSNVGKSSMLNCMLNSPKAARVSKTPGRTQAINLFQIGDACTFADLPGYGYAKVPDAIQAGWKGMVEGYLGGRPTLRLVCVLVDARREPQELDGMLLYGLMEAGIPALVVATKVDKLGKQELQRALATLREEFRLNDDELIAFSSVTKVGRDEVWARIERACR